MSCRVFSLVSRVFSGRFFSGLCSDSILCSLQCRRILGGRNLVRVRNVVVAAIFDFMTVEDWGE